MNRVLLLGAGTVGGAIARFLSQTGEYDILVGDVDAQALRRLEQVPKVHTIQLDSSNPAELERAMQGRQSVLSALNFSFNPTLAKAAVNSDASYFDLTEDVATTRAVKQVAQQAKPGQIFM